MEQNVCKEIKLSTHIFSLFFFHLFLILTGLHDLYLIFLNLLAILRKIKESLCLFFCYSKLHLFAFFNNEVTFFKMQDRVAFRIPLSLYNPGQTSSSHTNDWRASCKAEELGSSL